MNGWMNEFRFWLRMFDSMSRPLWDFDLLLITYLWEWLAGYTLDSYLWSYSAEYFKLSWQLNTCTCCYTIQFCYMLLQSLKFFLIMTLSWQERELSPGSWWEDTRTQWNETNRCSLHDLWAIWQPLTTFEGFVAITFWFLLICDGGCVWIPY